MITPQETWKGYTLDELRMHRVVNITKIELERARLTHLTQQYTNKEGRLTPFPIVNKLVGALDVFDYGLLAFRVIRGVLSVFKRRRR